MRVSLLRPIGLGVLLAIFLQSPAVAQNGTIAGLVRSAITQSPLVAAVVQVSTPGGDRVSSAITNQSGRFQISSIAPGSYLLTVTTTGYVAGSTPNLQVTAGQTTLANFDLQPRPFDLDPVVVSASRREERALDAPSRT